MAFSILQLTILLMLYLASQKVIPQFLIALEKIEKLFVHKSTESITYLLQHRKIKHRNIKVPEIMELKFFYCFNKSFKCVFNVSTVPDKLVCCCCESASYREPDGEYFMWLITTLSFI